LIGEDEATGSAQTRPLMPSALSKICFIALAHSSAVFLSSKTSVNVGDDPSS
jgi:hypothetical protein